MEVGFLRWDVAFGIESIGASFRNKWKKNVTLSQHSKFHVEERGFIFLSSCGCSYWQQSSPWQESWLQSEQPLQLRFEPQPVINKREVL